MWPGLGSTESRACRPPHHPRKPRLRISGWGAPLPRRSTTLTVASVSCRKRCRSGRGLVDLASSGFSLGFPTCDNCGFGFHRNLQSRSFTRGTRLDDRITRPAAQQRTACLWGVATCTLLRGRLTSLALNVASCSPQTSTHPNTERLDC